jgi:hypothetical protein
MQPERIPVDRPLDQGEQRLDARLY